MLHSYLLFAQDRPLPWGWAGLAVIIQRTGRGRVVDCYCSVDIQWPLHFGSWYTAATAVLPG